MKRIIALLLLLVLTLPILCGCGGAKTELSAPETPSNEATPSPESPALPSVSGSPLTSDGTVESGEIGYWVYYLTTKAGDKLAFRNNNLKINSEKELDARLTIHKKTVDGETYYGVYMGDDESRSLAISESGKIYAGFDKYKLTDSSLWKVTFEDGFARFQNKKEGTYLTVQGKKATLSELDAKDEGQLFEVKKAEKSARFDEYVSAKGNIVIRFTYEKMAECLNIHAHKGAMVTVYGFYGAAREFLLMAYDFGWDPFIRTFHWFQDNGYTQPDFERMEKFEKFVEKLSKYSGKDIKKEYLTVSWPIFEAFYTGKTSDAV